MDFFSTDAFFYSWIVAAFAFLGCILALILPPNPRILGFFGHFVIGIILAAIAVELVPRMKESFEKLPVISGFAIGAIFMLAMRYIISKLQKINSFSLMMAGVLDLLVDGFLLATSFYIAYQTGQFLVYSIAACAFFVVYYVSTNLKQRGKNRALIFLIALILAAMPAVGTILFELLSENSLQGEFQVEILSFATAALLYLAIEELVKEVHEQQESIFSVFGLFIGFLLVVLV